MDKRAVEQGDIRFFELAALSQYGRGQQDRAARPRRPSDMRISSQIRFAGLRLARQRKSRAE
jgi:hypothetical protein